MNKVNKRAEKAAEKIGYIGISYKAVKIFKEGAKAGYEQAEKDLIPLINRLCEIILFDWDNKAELAREIQSKIKEENNE